MILLYTLYSSRWEGTTKFCSIVKSLPFKQKKETDCDGTLLKYVACEGSHFWLQKNFQISGGKHRVQAGLHTPYKMLIRNATFWIPWCRCVRAFACVLVYVFFEDPKNLDEAAPTVNCNIVVISQVYQILCRCSFWVTLRQTYAWRTVFNPALVCCEVLYFEESVLTEGFVFVSRFLLLQLQSNNCIEVSPLALFNRFWPYTCVTIVESSW